MSDEKAFLKGPTQAAIDAFIRANTKDIRQGPPLWNLFNAFGFLAIVNIIIIACLFSIQQVANYQQVRDNWKEYRCQPMIMPFASLYGFNTADNFEFCMKNIFTGFAQEITSPFSSILGIFGTILATITSTITSIKESVATMGGGINTIFQDFTDRIMNFFFQLRLSAIRIKNLIMRMQATMYAVIYMGISGIKAGQNFSNTFLFSFLDTFCFPPETPVDVKGKGPIPIYQVQIGDILLPTRSRVTSKFHFAAQGQPMVRLKGGIEVSTNHYLLHDGKWIPASAHPDAVLLHPYERQSLICLNTHDHVIPMGSYRFRDYDETSSGDLKTMGFVEHRLNGVPSDAPLAFTENSPTLHPDTSIQLENGALCKAQDLHVNTRLSTGDLVTGLFHKEVREVCRLETGELVGAATLVWNPHTYQWTRAGVLYPVIRYEEPVVFIGLIVTTSSQIELASGTRIRDYLELCSPDAEQFYAGEMESL